MGRKWSSIAARESAWLPSNPTRLLSTSKRAAIAAASCSFQAMRIRSYRRRTGWSVEGAVSVLGIQNNSFYLTRDRNELFLQHNNSTIGEGAVHPPFAGMYENGEKDLIVGFYGRSGTRRIL